MSSSFDGIDSDPFPTLVRKRAHLRFVGMTLEQLSNKLLKTDPTEEFTGRFMNNIIYIVGVVVIVVVILSFLGFA
jgi:small-conductance mechanosensitive channel